MSRPIDGDAIKRRAWDVSVEWRKQGKDYEAMIDYDKLIEQAKKDAKGSHPVVPSWAAIVDKKQLKEYATAIETLQVENQALRNAANGFKAENEKLRTELERVKQENDALWMYIEIIDREYRRYMDRGYIDRLDELKKTWKHGSQKED